MAQSVLLYGNESWVVTGEMLKILTAFQHQAEIRITGMTDNRGAGGEWDHPAVEEVMDSKGIHTIGVYIKSRKTTILERVACRPVYVLCTKAERIPGTIRMMRWWYQDAVNDTEVYTRKRCN